MNKLIPILLILVLSCKPQEKTLQFHKTMMGRNVHKLEISERRAEKINQQVIENGCYEMHYYNDTLYITWYDYICNRNLFENGLFKNRELKKLNPKKLTYEWE